MIKGKEYPATHSMWTAWFAIDEDGNVAIMECDDNGPAPVGVLTDETSDSLLYDTLTSKEHRIAYTDEQLRKMMTHSVPPMEMAEIWNKFDFSHILHEGVSLLL